MDRDDCSKCMVEHIEKHNHSCYIGNIIANCIYQCIMILFSNKNWFLLNYAMLTKMLTIISNLKVDFPNGH